jgi:hypothetical protein
VRANKHTRSEGQQTPSAARTSAVDIAGVIQICELTYGERGVAVFMI